MTFALFAVVAAGVVVVVAGIVYQRIGAARDAQRLSPVGRLIDIAGRRVHIVSRGHGAPAVWFESAIAASSLSWSRVQPDVAEFTATYAYDRPGLGWSDPPVEVLTLERVVEHLRLLIASQASAASTSALPCVLVGHSFGAFVCLALAAAYPRDVHGLVLVDPPTDWIAMDRRQIYLLRGARQMSNLGRTLARVGVVRACLALLTGGAPEAPRYFIKVFGPSTARTIERLVGEIRKLPPEVYPLVQAAWCQPKSFHAMAGYLTVFEQAAASMVLQRLPSGMPLTVISAGDQPDDVKAEHERLARSSARGRHIVAEKSGHWVPFDEPELIVAATKEIVKTTTWHDR